MWGLFPYGAEGGVGKLTATGISKLLKTPGRYQDGDGLMLNVSAPGKGSWLLRVQHKGKRRDFGLGSAAGVGLAAARDKALEIRKLLAAGLDPVMERKKTQDAIPIFREAAVALHTEHAATWKNGKHRAQWLATLETYAYPEIGDRTVDAITAPMIRDVLLPIWLEIPETARRVRQRVLAVMEWAAAKGLREPAPTSRAVSRTLPRQPRRDGHFAAMPYTDVPSFLSKVRERESMGRLALAVVILTAARSGEVRGATWDEVDLEGAVWTVPAERMKAGKAHKVPLSKPALEIFETAAELRIAGSNLIFYGTNPKRPLSDMTLLKVLRDAGLSYSVHGFRSAFRDWAAERGVPDAIAEAALAHTVAGATVKAYKRTTFEDERRKVMERWGQFLSASAANVVPIKQKGRR